MVAVGDLLQDSKTANSSYSSPAVFKLQQLEARSLGSPVVRMSARPADIMYTVLWLACAQVLASQSGRKAGTALSWQDLSKRQRMLASSRKEGGRSPAYLVNHGVEAIQKVTAERGRGLQARAAAQACQSQPCRANDTGKISYFKRCTSCSRGFFIFIVVRFEHSDGNIGGV